MIWKSPNLLIPFYILLVNSRLVSLRFWYVLCLPNFRFCLSWFVWFVYIFFYISGFFLDFLIWLSGDEEEACRFITFSFAGFLCESYVFLLLKICRFSMVFFTSFLWKYGPMVKFLFHLIFYVYNLSFFSLFVILIYLQGWWRRLQLCIICMFGWGMLGLGVRRSC